jgi:hypothetical protein
MANPHPVYSLYNTRPHSQPVLRHQQYPYPVLDPLLTQSSSQPTLGCPRQSRATGPPPISLRAEFLAASPSRHSGRLRTSQHLQPPKRSYSILNNEVERREAVSTFIPSVNYDRPSLRRVGGQSILAHETNVCSTPKRNGERKTSPASSNTSADELQTISDYIPPRRELPFRNNKRPVLKDDEKETLENSAPHANASTSASTTKRKRKSLAANTWEKRPAPNLVLDHYAPTDGKSPRQNAKGSSKKRTKRSARLRPGLSTDAMKDKSPSQASQLPHFPNTNIGDGGAAIAPTDDASNTHVSALERRSELSATVSTLTLVA